MKPAILSLFIAFPLAAQAGEITPDALDSLPQAQVYVLGEIHDNAEHHRRQARAVAAIRPAAVVWEMLTEEQAARMPADRSDPAAVAEALDWEGSGWPEFTLYAPILEAAGPARHYGGEVPREAARGAFEDGAAAVFRGDARIFGLDRALDDAERNTREEEQFAAHCEAMPRAMMGGMVEAQRLRDAELARQVLKALSETGGPVAVITGSGHARTDWGMPAALARAAPGVGVLSIGQSESDPGPEAPWDLWLISAPVERPDPCQSLRARPAE